MNRVYPEVVISELGADESFFQADMGADWLPTFVTPDDARNYLNQTDAQWSQMNTEVSISEVSDVLRSNWSTDFDAWKKFRNENYESVGWLNTKAVMDQTDRWAERLQGWRATLKTAGLKTASPEPSLPGQGSQSDKPTVAPYLIGAGVATGVLAILAIAAKR